MKKTGKILLVLSLILMLVVSFRSAAGYRQDNTDLTSLQRRVENEVSSFVKAKEAASEDPESLKVELSKMETQLKQAAYFPDKFNGVAVSDYILQVFSSSGTEPVLFQPLGVSIETVGKGPYSVYKYQVKARGTLEQIKTFITDVEKNPYPAFRVDLVELVFARNQVDAGFQLIFIADLAK